MRRLDGQAPMVRRAEAEGLFTARGQLLDLTEQDDE